jgi:tRNA (guanine6-N2)-methyltransferase
MDVIVRCVRGVEWIAAAEARGRLAATVERIRHREVWLRGNAAPSVWAGLRTADDVFLWAGVAAGIGHTRNDLRVLAGAAAPIDWPGATAEAERTAGPFDVVASFLGQRNYNRFEIEDAVGAEISKQTGWPHRQRSPAGMPSTKVPLTVRVHIEDDEAVFGLRLADRPLHRRAWKERDTPGTLHPPVAAAMGLLAGIRPGIVIADPFCGAGTVGIELALEEPSAHVFVSDLGADALVAARHNIGVAGVADRTLVARADAGALPARPGSVDRVVTNTPWGRAVAPAGQLRHGWGSFATGLAAVLGEGGRATLLVDPAELDTLDLAVGAAGLAILGTFRLSVSGAWAAMVVIGGAPGPRIDAESRFAAELADELRTGIAPR